MILLGNTLLGLGVALSLVFDLLFVLTLVRAILSWVNPDPMNPIVRTVVASTDPFLRPIQRYIPQVGGLDLSPILLIIALYFLDFALAKSLKEYGHSLIHQAGIF